MQLTISQAIPTIQGLMKAKLVPLVKGSPGVGKSDIIHGIAKTFNLKVIDLRLAQCDPTDMLGFPQVKDGKADYVPMATFPLEGDKLPILEEAVYEDDKLVKSAVRYDGWLLFMDELTSAPKAIQAAAYKIILDRMVGNTKLHERVAVVAAGNLETDNAIVESMSTALQSRLIHLEIGVDLEEWLNWANVNGIDHRIRSFLRFKPTNLHTFQPDHTDHTYACPRTWKFADQILKVTADGSFERRAMLGGALTDGVAAEFLAYTELFMDLPTMEEIVRDPENAKLKDEPGTLYAIAGAVSSHMTAANVVPLLKYTDRMRKEFQVWALRDAIRRDKTLIQLPEMNKWIQANASEMF